jgi:hypothetical protein
MFEPSFPFSVTPQIWNPNRKHKITEFSREQFFSKTLFSPNVTFSLEAM